MKIAFAACMSTRVLQNQRVWDEIANHQPDYLVLLGDSIYIDINVDSEHQDPAEMENDEFSQHVHGLYSELVNQPQFANLVKSMPKGHVFSIWDDHDFLWNDMYGEMATSSPVLRDKVYISTAFQEAFRRALAQSLEPGSFPAHWNDAALQPQPAVPLSTPSIKLSDDVWLHLCDVRTFRSKPSKQVLLGAAQQNQIGAAIMQAPDAIHLLASGSTLSKGGVYSCWKRFENDLNWLKQLAANQRLIVLSGDIHENNVEQHATDGLPLHELTSSGAAIKKYVIFGPKLQNYGLLELDATTVKAHFFQSADQEIEFDRTIDRASWQIVS